MVNMTVQVPDDLRDKIARAAQHRGMSLNAFVRSCLASAVDRGADPLFSDSAVFVGDAPSDLSVNHDDYLSGDKT